MSFERFSGDSRGIPLWNCQMLCLWNALSCIQLLPLYKYFIWTRLVTELHLSKCYIKTFYVWQKLISVSNLEAEWKLLFHDAYHIKYGLHSIVLGQQQCRYISTGITKLPLILPETRGPLRRNNKYPASYSLVPSSRSVDHILHTLCKLLLGFIVYSNGYGTNPSNHSIPWHLHVPGHCRARRILSGTLNCIGY